MILVKDVHYKTRKLESIAINSETEAQKDKVVKLADVYKANKVHCKLCTHKPKRFPNNIYFYPKTKTEVDKIEQIFKDFCKKVNLKANFKEYETIPIHFDFF